MDEQEIRKELERLNVSPLEFVLIVLLISSLTTEEREKLIEKYKDKTN